MIALAIVIAASLGCHRRLTCPIIFDQPSQVPARLDFHFLA